MRRLYRSVMAGGLLAVLAGGCGSTAGDQLTMRFVRFDSIGLTQTDSVRQTSADVDVVQNICVSDTTATAEPFTETLINAVFVNEEAADILLERYRIYLPKIGNQDSGLGNFIEQTASRTLPGGRCSGEDRRCASNEDCLLAGATCVHSETTVSSLVLFDFVSKELLDRPEFFGIATNMTVTFFGTDDADHSFETSASYVVTFGDFDNCPSTGTGGA
jgi:hypothetical protein